MTINELSRHQLADRGIAATTVYNTFAVPDPGPTAADRPGAPAPRTVDPARLGIGDDDRLVLQPTRAIPRKNVAGGIGVATELDATYWLLGPAEDGYGPELDALVAAARCPVILGAPRRRGRNHRQRGLRGLRRGGPALHLGGLRQPTIESVVHRRPLAIGPYPVADELAAFGFDWFALSEMDRLRAWLEAPDPGLLDGNLAVAAAHFSLATCPTGSPRCCLRSDHAPGPAPGTGRDRRVP